VHEDPRESRGRPGVRAPHVALVRNGQAISTHDLLGHSFVLLAAPEAVGFSEEARLAASGLGMTVDVHHVGNGDGLVDPQERFCEAFGITSTGAVLVRPDGFVAWRATSANGGSSAGLGDALVSVLRRDAD
jgi:putative polyketide hydroxylase